jgi:hypothetical protein
MINQPHQWSHAVQEIQEDAGKPRQIKSTEILFFYQYISVSNIHDHKILLFMHGLQLKLDAWYNQNEDGTEYSGSHSNNFHKHNFITLGKLNPDYASSKGTVYT